MNPSDARVLSSGISGLLCSKKRNEISYSRLGQSDDSIEFSNVHFKKDSTSLCAKLCYGLLGLILLLAMLGSALFILSLRHFTMEVQLKRGNVRVYRFDQEMVVFGNKEKVATSNMSAFVTLHVINKTDSECWFGILLTLPKDQKKFFATRDFAFLVSVTSARIDNKAKRRFEVYGNSKTSSEFSFYIHNILRQLLPVIKVKLYEFVLSKMTSSTRRIEVEKQGYLPGPVHVTRTMTTKNDIVTVMSKADPNDFEKFSSKDGKSPIASWKLTYDETSVVNGNTGMLKTSDLFLSGYLPLGSDPTLDRRRMSSSNRGLDVSFRSVARLLDENQEKVKQWKDVVKNENDVSHRLNFASLEQTPLVYFAPERKSDKEPLNDLKELARLTKNSTGRSSKLPPTIQIVAPVLGNTESEWFDDDNGLSDDVIYNNDAVGVDDISYDDEVNDATDDDVTYNDVETNDVNDYDRRAGSVRSGNENKASWSTPNFSPYGLGYEVRRKRSVEINKADKKNKVRRTTRYTRFKKETPDLDAIWDELMSSTPRSNTEAPRVVRSSLLGLDFRTEIDYRVYVDDDDEDDDEDDDDREVDDEVGWRVLTAFRVTIGQYRITPFREVHTLQKIRRTLQSKGKMRSQWTVHAGDFVSQLECELTVDEWIFT